MGFRAEDYCARITDAARAHEIKTSGAAARPNGVDRKQEWRDLGAAQARDQAERIGAVVNALAGGFGAPATSFDPTAPPVSGWAEQFGRNIAQLWVLSYRAADKGIVDASLDELSEANRRAVYGYVARQYVGVVERLGFAPSFLKRLSVPMITTEIVDRILAQEDFAAFGLAVIRDAVTHHVLDPFGHLDACSAKIDALLRDPRFDWFEESVVKHAVFHRFHNPEELLDAVRAGFEVRRDAKAYPRYAAFPDATLLHAVVNYPTNPDKYLEGVLTQIERVTQDERYQHVPVAIIRSIAERYPKQVQARIDLFLTVSAELRASEFAAMGSLALRTAATVYADDPYPYLRRVRSNVARLAEDDRAQGLPKSEQLRIAATYEDPVRFVHTAADRAGRLSVLFGQASANQRLRFCAYYPKRAGELVGDPKLATTLDFARVFDRRDPVTRSVAVR